MNFLFTCATHSRLSLWRFKLNGQAGIHANPPVLYLSFRRRNHEEAIVKDVGKERPYLLPAEPAIAAAGTRDDDQLVTGAVSQGQ